MAWQVETSVRALNRCKNDFNSDCRCSLHHARATSFLGLFSKKEGLSNSGLLGIFFIGLVSGKHISHLLPCPLGAWVSQREPGRAAPVFHRSWGWNNAARGLSRWRCLDYLSSLLHSRVAHTILRKKHLSKYRHGLLCLRGEPSVTQGNFVNTPLKIPPRWLQIIVIWAECQEW